MQLHEKANKIMMAVHIPDEGVQHYASIIRSRRPLWSYLLPYVYIGRLEQYCGRGAAMVEQLCFTLAEKEDTKAT